MWQKEKLLIKNNISFCHNVFKMSSAFDASESVCILERVKESILLHSPFTSCLAHLCMKCKVRYCDHILSLLTLYRLHFASNLHESLSEHSSPSDLGKLGHMRSKTRSLAWNLVRMLSWMISKPCSNMGHAG